MNLSTDDLLILRKQLVLHEGLRLVPYVDTVGKVTIGVGRNLTDVGVSLDEAMALLDHDIQTATDALSTHLPWIVTLDSVRQRALIDLTFNMGIARLLKFTHFLTALEAKDYETASKELLHSNYATQVGRRATTLAAMIRTGHDVRR